MSEKKRKRERRERRKALNGGSAVRRDADGRAHLVVQRDAAGRVARLGLTQPLFEQTWQNELAVAAASTAHAALAAGTSLDAAAGLAESAMAATSKIANGLLAGETKLACRAGCAHCCYQAVGVSAPEVFAIYRYLKRTRTPEALSATLDRVRAADARTRGLRASERLSPELPCPFLDGARCTIYEVRPLACRGKNSLDAGACDTTLHDATARAELLAGQRGVPCFVEPIRVFHAIAAGVQLTLAELHGLHAEPLELTAAVRVLADDADAVIAAWLCGEDPFVSARGADTSDDESIRRLSGRSSPGGGTRGPLPP